MSFWKRLQRSASKDLLAQGARFILVGALNTLGTVILYQILLFVLSYSLAYALSWIAGLIFVNIAYPVFVYGKTALNGRDTAINSIYYVTSFCASWLLLYLFTARAGVPARLSIFLVLVVIVPMNFLATRYIYRPGKPSSPETP